MAASRFGYICLRQGQREGSGRIDRWKRENMYQSWVKMRRGRGGTFHRSPESRNVAFKLTQGESPDLSFVFPSASKRFLSCICYKIAGQRTRTKSFWVYGYIPHLNLLLTFCAYHQQQAERRSDNHTPPLDCCRTLLTPCGFTASMQLLRASVFSFTLHVVIWWSRNIFNCF